MSAEACKTDRGNRVAAYFLGQLAAHSLLQLVAEHHGNEIGARQFRQVAAADQPSVAQYGGAIGDGVDLIQKMGDDDDAEAFCLQLAQHAEQHFDFACIETGGRFVKDEHLAREIDGTCNRDDLADGD